MLSKTLFSLRSSFQANNFHISGITPVRFFAQAARYVGPNDNIRQEQRQMRKYGMKRHFYDKLKLQETSLPTEHYRSGLNEQELGGYNDQVKQAFSLQNASDSEIYSAKYQQIISMFGKHQLDCGNQAIKASISCERVISLLDHLRENHKDVSALIRLQRQLAIRRKDLFYLKRNDFLSYHQVLRVYGLEDLQSEKGEGIHQKHFHCKNPKRP